MYLYKCQIDISFVVLLQLFTYLPTIAITIKDVSSSSEFFEINDGSNIFSNYLLSYDGKRFTSKSKESVWSSQTQNTKKDSLSMPIDVDLLIPMSSHTNNFQSNQETNKQNNMKQKSTDNNLFFLRKLAGIFKWNTKHSERRLFMIPMPFRKLMIAYFAPRILRFQMSMLLSALIGEISRKFLDPFLGLTTNLESGNVNRSPPLNTQHSKSSPPSTITPDELRQIQQLVLFLQESNSGALRQQEVRTAETSNKYGEQTSGNHSTSNQDLNLQLLNLLLNEIQKKSPTEIHNKSNVSRSKPRHINPDNPTIVSQLPNNINNGKYQRLKVKTDGYSNILHHNPNNIQMQMLQKIMSNLLDHKV